MKILTRFAVSLLALVALFSPIPIWAQDSDSGNIPKHLALSLTGNWPKQIGPSRGNLFVGDDTLEKEMANGLELTFSPSGRFAISTRVTRARLVPSNFSVVTTAKDIQDRAGIFSDLSPNTILTSATTDRVAKQEMLDGTINVNLIARGSFRLFLGAGFGVSRMTFVYRTSTYVNPIYLRYDPRFAFDIPPSYTATAYSEYVPIVAGVDFYPIKHLGLGGGYTYNRFLSGRSMGIPSGRVVVGF